MMTEYGVILSEGVITDANGNPVVIEESELIIKRGDDVYGRINGTKYNVRLTGARGLFWNEATKQPCQFHLSLVTKYPIGSRVSFSRTEDNKATQVKVV
jgi:hypothetical protein